ncbi:helix-turn-helix transcriptional regulator [Saccharopolyspora gloriosae]
MSRVELAEQGITEADVSALLVALGVVGPEREQLLKMTRELDQPVWWETRHGLPAVLTELIEVEQRAKTIVDVANTLIPGLLQTRSYSRALLDEAMPAHQISDAVAVRQNRQDVLERADPVQFTAYVDEAVLLRPVGGHLTTAEQLRHLLSVGRRPNVSIHLIPLSIGVHRGLDGQFMLLKLPNGTVNVHAEASNAGFLLDETEEVKPFVETVEHIESKALGVADSAILIEEHADRHMRKET